jgi:predicted O-methyltransferase YrrM
LAIASIYTEQLLKFVQDHLNGDPALLLLSHQGKVDFDLKMAVQQIQARQKAKSKLPEWVADPRLLFPPSLSLEQASSSQTAAYKAKLVQGKTLLDITGGFGIDAYYIGQHFDKITYCERQSDLAELAQHNFEVLAPGKFQVFEGDGIGYLKQAAEKYDLIYVDPARRGKANEKLYRLTDCEPDITAHWKLLRGKSKQVLCKISPMTDIKQALQDISDFQQIWVISVKNEVKEVLLFWDEAWQGTQRAIHAVDLNQVGEQTFHFSYEEETEAGITLSEVSDYLIEPLACILKAGAFRSFAQRFGLQKLHANSHLYTSKKANTSLPARVFEVVTVLDNPKKQIQQTFKDGKANVLTRNYSLSPEDLKKKYKLKDGGEDYLIGTKTMKGNIPVHAKRLK